VSSLLTDIRNLRATECANRRLRFAALLSSKGLDAAILSRSAHVAYFFGTCGWRCETAAGVVSADGHGLLAVGTSVDCENFADKLVRYDDNRGGTPCDDLDALAAAALSREIQGFSKLGTDAIFSGNTDFTPVSDLIRGLRRCKHADEVKIIEAAIRATEAGYLAVAPMIRPGILETEVYAAFYGAATVSAGTSIRELGNDFRGGAPGGRPRHVALSSGDLLPVDAGVVLAHYNADLCRTLAVSGKRSHEQETVFGYVEEALERAERAIKPGVSCSAVYSEISSFLNSRGPWRFEHHLGHGIGLAPVEAPRISPHWNDTFQEGDTFSLEPGLYGGDARAGVRLEQNYTIQDGKVRRLSMLPLDL
jgi:Xaa-Pro dipeptidase